MGGGGAPEPPPWPEDLVVRADEGARELLEHSRRDRALELNSAEAPTPLRELLESRGTRSILAVPILLEEEWWGSLVLPSVNGPRHWSTSEVEALRISARLIAAAVRRRRIRRALRASEARYRNLVEGASQPILILDKDGRFLFANRFACDAVRLTPGGDRAEADLRHLPGGLRRQSYGGGEAGAQQRPANRLDQSARSSGAANAGSPPGCSRSSTSGTDGRRRWSSSPTSPSEKETERRILEYQSRLRSLSSELALAEQRERRRIAAELHDRIGQSLAIARIKLGRGAAATGSARPVLDEVRALLDQSIQDTRTLTFELSPPILYELGLEPGPGVARSSVSRPATAFSTTFRATGSRSRARRRTSWASSSSRCRSCSSTWSSTPGPGTVAHRAVTQEAGRPRDRGGRRRDRLRSVPAPATGRTPGGFGLFSIRERLEHLGGSFDIDSQPGKGTRARLRCPLRAEARATKRKRQTMSTRILIADDHRIMREGLRALLGRAGRVHGRAARRRTAARRSNWPRASHPDIVIMDVTMPGLNGIEATRQIMARPPGDEGHRALDPLRPPLRAADVRGRAPPGTS